MFHGKRHLVLRCSHTLRTLPPSAGLVSAIIEPCAAFCCLFWFCNKMTFVLDVRNSGHHNSAFCSQFSDRCRDTISPQKVVPSRWTEVEVKQKSSLISFYFFSKTRRLTAIARCRGPGLTGEQEERLCPQNRLSCFS